MQPGEYRKIKDDVFEYMLPTGTKVIIGQKFLDLIEKDDSAKHSFLQDIETMVKDVIDNNSKQENEL
jgi:hypothetical protein